MLRLTFPFNISVKMSKTYKVEGIIGKDTLSLLCMELGSIEARKVENEQTVITESKQTVITVFYYREGTEAILASFGIKILEIISNTQ